MALTSWASNELENKLLWTSNVIKLKDGERKHFVA